jgi:hypothetical protein
MVCSFCSTIHQQADSVTKFPAAAETIRFAAADGVPGSRFSLVYRHIGGLLQLLGHLSSAIVKSLVDLLPSPVVGVKHGWAVAAVLVLRPDQRLIGTI